MGRSLSANWGGGGGAGRAAAAISLSQASASTGGPDGTRQQVGWTKGKMKVRLLTEYENEDVHTTTCENGWQKTGSGTRPGARKTQITLFRINLGQMK